MTIVVAVVVATILGTAVDAEAHAELVGTDPSAGAVIEAAPQEVRLDWTNPVDAAFGGVRVWGPDGRRVDADGGDHGRTITSRITDDGPGTYAVAYRVVSRDGHHVRGTFSFHVGRQTAAASSEEVARADVAVNRAVEAGSTAVRGAALLAVLLLGGGIAFASFVAPGTRPRGIGRLLVLASAALVASFLLDASSAGGYGLAEVARVDVLRAEAGTPRGRVVLVELVLLVLLAVWLRLVPVDDVRSWGRRVAIALPGLAPVAAWSFGGHALTGEPVLARLPLDSVHLVAASIWLGGLVQLAAYLAADRPSIEHVERWSRVALVSIVVLVASGAVAALIEVGLSREAAVETAYGRIVVGKLLLLFATLPLAWLNRRHHVPLLRDRRRALEGVTRLRRYVLGEAAILVLVVAMTAVLIQTEPARSAVASQPVDRSVQLAADADLQLVIDPAREGANSIHLNVTDGSGAPDEAVSGVRLVAGNRRRSITGLVLPLARTGPGHFAARAISIPAGGEWTFEVVVSRGRRRPERATVTATIEPAGRRR